MIVALFWFVPLRVSSWFFGKALRWGGRFHPTYKVGVRNVGYAMPETDKAERQRIVLGCFENFGRMIGEFTHGKAFVKNFEKLVTVEGGEYLLALKERGAIICIPHLGNWDPLAVYFHRIGIEPMTIYRRANNPWIEKLFLKARQDFGNTNLLPKGKDTVRPMVEHLRNKGFVNLLYDQRIDEGIIVPLFGHPAKTAPFAGAAHVKNGVSLVGARCVRTAEDPVKFRIIIDPIPTVNKTGDNNADVLAVMTMLNAKLEEWIRQNPEQYLWIHNRFKGNPDL
jgi:KDO2-lipid IV(A) lauroyltransferase